MEPILECKNLKKLYTACTGLQDVNLTLERGKIIGLLGPNGSGKTTLIKLINNLLVPTSGTIKIGGYKPGLETKSMISYLPDRTYLNNWMRISDCLNYFSDFYSDFDLNKAHDMLKRLNLDPSSRLKTLSKGNKEKVQLILVMSRQADLYCLDEPIGGVDPASRDYILETILSNYNENGTVLISTHLIADIENVLDEVIFLKNGCVMVHSSVDDIRMKEGKSVDSLFREVFRC
ncbi:ABC transporter ATP-binding protein [[Clostridium] polysaccharolyticum]|uniref:ABC-2 type transport system ATP-binding protein n=1 Tax=[Clostridium] polysaccharolyticum TaxID=29364 RepID=A0A1H9ZB59_9FIRM|nr:ABC transporter ATP-binding protein [[Clostridium] polysaccharolyticum]SES78707.1 ABC-2 type transport system ATP-binding protein [[Clostridium] polysaccharolyticum]